MAVGLLAAPWTVAARVDSEHGSSVDSAAALAASQAAVGRLVGDYRFVRRDGTAVRTADLRGKPAIVSPIYTSCDHVCNVTTRYLAQMVSIARDALGAEQFAVVTVGFDSRSDTPDRMSAYAARQGVDDPSWQFLSGDVGAVRGLTRDIGFTFAPSPRGFDHIAQVTILDTAGRVYRQIYGDRFEPPALVEPLKELVFGRTAAAAPALGRWLDGLKLLCTVYDPSSGRYRFDYSIFVGGAIGILCLSAIAIFLIRAWAQSSRLHRL